MSEDGKLVNVSVDLGNVGELSKPAHALVNRLSEVLGNFTRPYHIKRMADAEAYAAVVKAETKQKISKIEERGLRRMVFEEGKRQENIEQIASKALPHIKDSAEPSKLDSDWISNFFDKCRLVSDSDLQEMWSKLLADETNSPNTVSKRTVALFASLDKKDAQLFTRFASTVWDFGVKTPIIFHQPGEDFSIEGLGFRQLKHLASIGLIDYETTAGFQRIGLPQLFGLVYYGRIVTLELPQGAANFDFGKVMLTEAGLQLVDVCGGSASESYFDYVIKEFADRGLNPRSPVLLASHA